MLSVEEQKGDDATADGCIGEIEDGAEENKSVASKERNPLRPVSIDDGEVEHVYHFSMEPCGITSAFGQELGHLRVCAFTEEYTVEHAVDDVAQGACQNQRHAEDEARGDFSLDLLVKIPSDE